MRETTDGDIVRDLQSIVRVEGVDRWKVSYLYSPHGKPLVLTYVIVLAKDELGAFMNFKNLFKQPT